MARTILATTLVTSVFTLGYPFAVAIAVSMMPFADGFADAQPSWSLVSHDSETNDPAETTDDASDTDTDSDTAPSTEVAASGDDLAVTVIDPDSQPTACPANVDGAVGSAPAISVSDGAITGTTHDDLVAFAARFNEIRTENCLEPVPTANFVYDDCMETRLVWMAQDPSTDPASAWGHEGSVRSDGVESVGCDGNLAGGSDNSGATVAQKWWDSPAHRASLFRPDIVSGVADVCVHFAMTHGGVPNEPQSFTRAAARWQSC